MMVCKNLDFTIQTSAEQMVTTVALDQPVILSPRRRICAQVERPNRSARSFVVPVLSFTEGLRVTTLPKPWSVRDQHNRHQALSVT
jgi:hypothetical protein